MCLPFPGGEWRPLLRRYHLGAPLVKLRVRRHPVELFGPLWSVIEGEHEVLEERRKHTRVARCGTRPAIGGYVNVIIPAGR